MNTIQKLNNEHNSTLLNVSKIWLKIRLVAGMESLITDVNRLFKTNYQNSPDLPEDISVYAFQFDSGDYWDTSPELYWDSAIANKRSRQVSGTADAFPSVFLPEDMVLFYSTTIELQQAIREQQPGQREKLIINLANVVSIEKVIISRVYAQNIQWEDVAHGLRFKEPEEIKPLELVFPDKIPTIDNPSQEMLFPIAVKNGIEPYRFSMMNQPKDLYVTEDGWVRGYIEEDQWPLNGYRDFFMVIVVEDSSVPKRTIGAEFRYRLYARV